MNFDLWRFAKKPTLEDEIRKKASLRIRKAKSHPMSPERLSAIEKQFAELHSGFVHKGAQDAEATKQEDLIRAEIINSSAIAHDLAEFKAILKELVSYGPGLHVDLIYDWLSHENAHANVAQATGHNFIGYGILFLKEGNRIGVQPFCLYDPNIS